MRWLRLMRLAFVLLLVVGLGGVRGGVQDNVFDCAEQVEFTVARNLPYAAQSTVNGDLDGDGYDDVAIAAQELDEVVAIYSSGGVSDDGRAVNWTTSMVTNSFSNPSGIAVADMDGDAILDMVTSSSSSSAFTGWFRNSGSARSFIAEVASFDNAACLGTGDFEGDGDVDIAIATTSRMAWLLNDGDGESYEELIVASVSSNPTRLAVLDANNDGYLDMAVGDVVFNTATIYMMLDGPAGTEPSSAVAFAGTPFVASVIAIAAGDLDNDGDSDLCVTSTDYSTSTSLNIVACAENVASNGTVWHTYEMNYTVVYGRSIVMHDVDGDSYTDVVTAGYYKDDQTLTALNNSVTWFRNRLSVAADGSLTDAFTFTAVPLMSDADIQSSPATLGMSDVATSDVDLDGDTDIIVTLRSTTSSFGYVGELRVLRSCATVRIHVTAKEASLGFPYNCSLDLWTGSQSLWCPSIHTAFAVADGRPCIVQLAANESHEVNSTLVWSTTSLVLQGADDPHRDVVPSSSVIECGSLSTTSSTCLSVQNATSFRLESVVVRNSWRGSALVVRDCGDAALTNVTFENNTIDSGNGAALQVLESPLSCTRCNFLRNNASGVASFGGAVYVRALEEEGSDTDDADDTDDIDTDADQSSIYLFTSCHFVGNAVPRGGGGAVFWTSADTDSYAALEPQWSIDTVFEGNSAAYGDDKATEPRNISLLEPFAYTQVSGAHLKSESGADMVVQLVDYYGSVTSYTEASFGIVIAAFTTSAGVSPLMVPLDSVVEFEHGEVNASYTRFYGVSDVFEVVIYAIDSDYDSDDANDDGDDSNAADDDSVAADDALDDTSRWSLFTYLSALVAVDPCAPGYFRDYSALYVCSACAAGFFTTTTEATSCDACSKGYYCEKGSSSSTQFPCPAGTFGSSTGLPDATCSGQCSAGYFCAINSTSDTQAECGDPSIYCPAGTPVRIAVDEGYCGVGFSDETQYDQEACVLVLHSITPSTSATRGGDMLLIRGENLYNVTVTIGDDWACNVLRNVSNTTHVWCTIPAGHGSDLTVAVTAHPTGSSDSLVSAFSYAAPELYSVSGCLDGGSADDDGDDDDENDDITSNTNATWNCPTAGGTLLLFEGRNFYSSADVLLAAIDGSECTSISIVVAHYSFACTLPAGVGSSVSAGVVVGGVGVEVNGLLSYAKPTVLSVTGCNDTGTDLPVNGTSGCARSGTDLIAVRGLDFGALEATVIVGGHQAELVAQLTVSTGGDDDTDGDDGDPDYDSVAFAVVPAGSGSFVSVSVLQRNGRLSAAKNLLSYATCQPGTANQYNSTTGSFVCVACDPGYYTDELDAYACSECASGSFSPNTTSCIACDARIARSTSDAGSISVSDCYCSSNFVLDNDSDSATCNCGPGTFFDESINSCTACPVGTYSAEYNLQTDCTNCPSGATTASTGSTALTDCECDAAQGFVTANITNTSTTCSCDVGTYFVEATADDDGALDSCTLCAVGEYQDEYTLDTSCKSCDDILHDSSTQQQGSVSPNDCVCAAGKYADNNEATCTRCGHGLKCPAGSTLESLILKRGYWRSSPSSTSIRSCLTREACPGGNDTTACTKGYEGPLCATCSKDYSSAIVSSECHKCEDKQLTVFVLTMSVILIICIAAFLWLAYKYCTARKRFADRARDTHAIAIARERNTAATAKHNEEDKEGLFEDYDAHEGAAQAAAESARAPSATASVMGSTSGRGASKEVERQVALSGNGGSEAGGGHRAEAGAITDTDTDTDTDTLVPRSERWSSHAPHMSFGGWLALGTRYVGDGVTRATNALAVGTLSTKLRILLNYYQILSGSVSGFDIDYPSTFERFVDSSSALNLDVLNLFNFGCVVHADFFSELLVITITPIVLACMIGAYVLCTGYRFRRAGDRATAASSSSSGGGGFLCGGLLVPKVSATRLRHKQQNMTSLFLALCYIVFPGVSLKITNTFACDTLDDGESYLRADYSINCDSDKYKSYRAYAICMVFVYPVAITALFATMLFQHRGLINPPNMSTPDIKRIRAQNPRIRFSKFLWTPYRPRYWWFEIFECCRRLALTAIPALFFSGTSTQIVLGFTAALFSVVVYTGCRPFNEAGDNFIGACAMVALSFTMFIGLLINANVTKDDHWNMQALGTALLLMCNTILVVAACAFVVALRPTYLELRAKNPDESRWRTIKRVFMLDVERRALGEHHKGRHHAPSQASLLHDGQAINTLSPLQQHRQQHAPPGIELADASVIVTEESKA